MKTLKKIVGEVVGLFVDDGSFALAILACLVLVWVVVHSLQLARAGGVLIFVGLGAILLESVQRYARKRLP